MTATDTFHRVREALHGITGADKGGITPESPLNGELFLDSLEHIELEMALEDEFGFGISDEDCAKWDTVSDICAYVDDRQKGWAA